MHDPDQAANDLAKKLASRNRHVMFLLGAGASCVAGLPNLIGLKRDVDGALTGSDQTEYRRLGVTRNLEEILSRLRLVSEVLRDSADTFHGFTGDTAKQLDKRICTSIADIIQNGTLNHEAHLRFARWCARTVFTRPVEVFTTNYDNLIERGLEQVGVPYFDGFVGSYEGLFRADLVDTTDGRDEITPPTGWVRVWKLHGSISWSRVVRRGASLIVRSAVPGESLAIYPSLQKYEESRRLPFVVLADRLRRALAVPETTCIVSGYSFGDQHINDLYYDAAQFYPASEIVVLCFSDIPNELADRAKTLQNLTVFSPLRAVIGAKEDDWQILPDDTPFWKAGAFALGDFAVLTEFLLVNTKPGSDLFLTGGLP